MYCIGLENGIGTSLVLTLNGCNLAVISNHPITFKYIEAFLKFFHSNNILLKETDLYSIILA